MDEQEPWTRQAVVERLARIGHIRVTLWFLGLGLLACVPNGIVAAARGDQPGPLETVLRFLLAFVCFNTTLIVFVLLIARYGNKHSD